MLPDACVVSQHSLVQARDTCITGALRGLFDSGTIRTLAPRTLASLYEEHAGGTTFEGLADLFTVFPNMQDSIDAMLAGRGAHVPRGTNNLTVSGVTFPTLLMMLGKEACAAADDPTDDTMTYSFDASRCLHRFQGTTSRLRHFFDGRDFGQDGFDELGSNPPKNDSQRLASRLLKVLPVEGEVRAVIIKLDALRTPGACLPWLQGLCRVTLASLLSPHPRPSACFFSAHRPGSGRISVAFPRIIAGRI